MPTHVPDSSRTTLASSAGGTTVADSSGLAIKSTEAPTPTVSAQLAEDVFSGVLH